VNAVAFDPYGADDSVPVTRFQFMGHGIVITYGTHHTYDGYRKLYDAFIDGHSTSIQFQNSVGEEIQAVMSDLQGAK
jgi:hypothetical protein